MTVADAVCNIFDSQLQNFSLWPEELFVWSAAIVDDVKERGDQYMERIGNLWKEHYRVFRGFDKSIPQDELQLSVALVLYVPIMMLQNSKDSVHRYMGRQILNSVSLNYEAWEKTFINVAASCKQLSPQISEWFNGFMALDNDQYLSDEIADLLEPLTPGEAKPKGGNIYVTVKDGGEFVQNKTVEKSIGKIEAGGMGFVEQTKEGK